MPEMKASLLVVDDESSIRTSLSQSFAADGHSVRSFPKVLDGTISPAGDTNCLYCGSLIRYVAVQPYDQPLLQTFLLPLQRRHSAPLPALRSLQKLAS